MHDLTPIPAGAALFHIGSPKTATSAIQYTCAARRDELLEAGLLYPKPRAGTERAHRHVSAVHALRLQGDGKARRAEEWDELLEQHRAHPEARMLVSDEWAATLPPRAVERARDTLGDGSQVVLSLRNYADFLLSLWQEDLRAGKVAVGVEEWLRARDLGPFDQTSGWIPIERQADRLRRWVDAFGADRVNVVVTDKADPDLVFHAFAGLLGMDDALLRPTSAAHRGPAGNRGLTAVEARFVLRAVQAAVDAGMDEEHRQRILHRGAFKRLQHRRKPPIDEPRPGIPAAMAAQVEDFAAQQWGVIEQLGVRVIGSREEFLRPGRQDPQVRGATVPTGLAIQALIGASLASRSRIARRGEAPQG